MTIMVLVVVLDIRSVKLAIYGNITGIVAVAIRKMHPMQKCAARRCLMAPARCIRGDVVSASFDVHTDAQVGQSAKLVIVNDLNHVRSIAADLDLEMVMAGRIRKHVRNFAANVPAGLELVIRRVFPLNDLLIVDRKKVPVIHALGKRRRRFGEGTEARSKNQDQKRKADRLQNTPRIVGRMDLNWPIG